MNKKRLIIILTTILLFIGLQLLAGQIFPSFRPAPKSQQQSASKNRANEHKLQRNRVSHSIGLGGTGHYSIVDDHIKRMRLATYLSALRNKTSDLHSAWSVDEKDWMGKQGDGASASGLLGLRSTRSNGGRNSLTSIFPPTQNPGANNPAGSFFPGYPSPAWAFPARPGNGPTDNTYFPPGNYPPSWGYPPGEPQAPGSPVFYFPYPGGISPPQQDDPTQKVVPLPGSALLLAGTLSSVLLFRRRKTI